MRFTAYGNGVLKTRKRMAFALIIPLAIAILAMMPFIASSVLCDAQTYRAHAAENEALIVGSADSDVKKMSGGFSVSSTRLNLTPKIKKVPYGHKYIPRSKTVTVRIPDSSYYPVYWRTSNTDVAVAKWSENYKRNEIKLTVYGLHRGKATIYITNAVNYKTLKIHVTVGGYNSKDFKASATDLNLSPKKKKTSNGVKYSPKKKVITVAVPDGASVNFKSSNSSVASAQWAKKWDADAEEYVGKWNGNTTKLIVTGYARGKSTITLTNSKTKKKVKIRVTVGGYDLGFQWGNPAAKSEVTANGATVNYVLDNFKLINETGKKVVLDQNCAFRFWSITSAYYKWLYGVESDYKEGDNIYQFENQPAIIRDAPVTIKKSKSKRIYVGEKRTEVGDDVWEKAILTAKIGNAYKTIYVDKHGMVTEVHNGRDI